LSLLIKKSQNIRGFFLHQFNVTSGLHVQPHEGLGVGFAQVQAPLRKVEAEAVDFLVGKRVGAEVLPDRVGWTLCVCGVGSNRAPSSSWSRGHLKHVPHPMMGACAANC